MAHFETYANAYSLIKLTRRDGILEMKLHSKGGPMKWSTRAQVEIGDAFRNIALDPDNRVVIFTGTGDAFIGEHFKPTGSEAIEEAKRLDVEKYDAIMTNAQALTNGMLDIRVPVIAAINGPARVHAELPLICDLVLASDTAEFQDIHFKWGIVPGDGDHVIWPRLLGPARGRYFLLMGQILSSEDALRLGIVNEVLPPGELMSRAWQIAEELASQPPLVTKYARALFTAPMKRDLANDLPLGLALEGLAATSGRWVDLSK